MINRMNKAFTRKVDIAYVFIFYVGFQGGRYYLENRIQELSFVVVLTLFAFGAIKLAMQRADVKWGLWFWIPSLIISYPMIISSTTYYLNTGSNIFYSFFATREFLIIYLAPTIFYMYKLGYPIERLEKLFVISIIIAILNYLFFYLTLDLVALKWGSHLYMSQQITFDEWRGYRLKPPTAALYLATSYFLILMMYKLGSIKKFGVIIILSMVMFCWYIVVQRSQITMLILSTILYPILFSRPSRINVLIFVLPVVFLTILLFLGTLVEIFFEVDKIRKETYRICLEIISEIPILGFGTASWKGITYQTVLGQYFYPSDSGFIGICFKYGILGGSIYLYILLLIVVRSVKTNWHYFFYKKKINPLLIALVIWVIGTSINFLVAELVFMQGIYMASFIIGLTACYRDKFSQTKFQKTDF